MNDGRKKWLIDTKISKFIIFIVVITFVASVALFFWPDSSIPNVYNCNQGSKNYAIPSGDGSTYICTQE